MSAMHNILFKYTLQQIDYIQLIHILQIYKSQVIECCELNLKLFNIILGLFCLKIKCPPPPELTVFILNVAVGGIQRNIGSGGVSPREKIKSGGGVLFALLRYGRLGN